MKFKERDVKRIDPFLQKLGRIWKEFPDLRFQQLITLILHEGVNRLEFKGDSFYWEEDKWEAIFDSLIEFYGVKNE